MDQDTSSKLVPFQAPHTSLQKALCGEGGGHGQKDRATSPNLERHQEPRTPFILLLGEKADLSSIQESADLPVATIGRLLFRVCVSKPLRTGLRRFM